MKTTTVKLAYHASSERVIHVRNAQNGVACGCICLDCGEKFEAIQGNIKDWHFRHYNSNCNGGIESSLHQLGKQILLDNTQISIPNYGRIVYVNPVSEKAFEHIRPDVSATHGNGPIFFEIAVKHFNEPSKNEFLSNGNHKCIEINLSAEESLEYDYIKSKVLEETSNKKLYGWPMEQRLSNSESWITKALVGIGLFFLFRWMVRKRRH